MHITDMAIRGSAGHSSLHSGSCILLKMGMHLFLIEKLCESEDRSNLEGFGVHSLSGECLRRSSMLVWGGHIQRPMVCMCISSMLLEIDMDFG